MRLQAGGDHRRYLPGMPITASLTVLRPDVPIIIVSRQGYQFRESWPADPTFRMPIGPNAQTIPIFISPQSLDPTASMAYTCPMIIIETPIFTRQLLSTLSDEEYRLFQATLLEKPDRGKVIPGGGGLRKIRWGLEGRGKSGGARVIYYWFTARGTILLLFMYPKNVQENLTQDQLRQLRKIVEEDYHER